MAVLVYKWDFLADADGWSLAPTSTWGAGYGDSSGGLRWVCSSGGGGCSNSCVSPDQFTCTRWSSTFEGMGIPAGSTITRFLHIDGSDTTHMRTKGSGAGTNYLPRNGLKVYVDTTGFGYSLRKTFFTNHTPSAGWNNVNASSSSFAVTYDSDSPVLFSFGHQLAIRSKSIGTITDYLDEIQVLIQYTPPVATRRVFAIT